MPTFLPPPILSGFPKGLREGTSLPPAQAALLGSDASARPRQLKMTWAIFAPVSCYNSPFELAAAHTSPDHGSYPHSSLTHNH